MTPPVTQAARDAAGKMIRDYWGDTDPQMIALAQSIEAGCADHATFVQAFAKAIAEETARCAKLADDAQIPARRKALGNPDCAWNDACRDIATAIRATEVGNG